MLPSERGGGDRVRQLCRDDHLPVYVPFRRRRVLPQLVHHHVRNLKRRVTCLNHKKQSSDNFPNLQISVNHEIGVEVLVVLAEGVEESLGDFEPAHVEQELQRGEYGKVVVVAVRLNISRI